MPRTDNQRGMMVAVETAIILPVLLGVVGLLIVLATHALAQMTVTSAASQAARAASIERDTATATSSARAVAASTLVESGTACRTSSVTVNTAGLRAPLGSPASVAVTVTCTVDFGVGLPGFPQTRTLTATKTSPVDTYRSRR